MKIQYPGVADSIESDIENVKLLLNYTNLIPERLYLDNAMQVSHLLMLGSSVMWIMLHHMSLFKQGPYCRKLCLVGNCPFSTIKCLCF